jgi:hypothetical protein
LSPEPQRPGRSLPAKRFHFPQGNEAGRPPGFYIGLVYPNYNSVDRKIKDKIGILFLQSVKNCSKFAHQFFGEKHIENLKFFQKICTFQRTFIIFFGPNSSYALFSYSVLSLSSEPRRKDWAGCTII